MRKAQSPLKRVLVQVWGISVYTLHKLRSSCRHVHQQSLSTICDYANDHNLSCSGLVWILCSTVFSSMTADVILMQVESFEGSEISYESSFIWISYMRCNCTSARCHWLQFCSTINLDVALWAEYGWQLDIALGELCSCWICGRPRHWLRAAKQWDLKAPQGDEGNLPFHSSHESKQAQYTHQELYMAQRGHCSLSEGSLHVLQSEYQIWVLNSPIIEPRGMTANGSTCRCDACWHFDLKT